MSNLSTDTPLVSCIMPTYNRRRFVPHAIRYFLRQDYENKELIVIDDGNDSVEDLIPFHKNISYHRLANKITLGAKLNLGCELARGDFIAHWDDDDWYDSWRLTYQMNAMQSKDIKLCGINQLLYHNLANGTSYQYRYPADQKVWLSGSSLCYTKELWQTNKFADINVGMDGLFVWATPRPQIRVLEDHTYSVLFIHPQNVSPKKTSGSWWHTYSTEHIKEIIGKDWASYKDSQIKASKEKVSTVSIPPINTTKAIIKNVFACLVHEKPKCINDLVNNLHFHDPHSIILLYNGSEDANLLKTNLFDSSFQVHIHPNPQPQQHGYLHGFALDCMTYAVKHFDFDTLTIVDSDQLLIRSGYSQYLTDFLFEKRNIGMFSSNPQRITQTNRTNHVAAQAFREFELWQPLLDMFPNGEGKFVHWTFWPTTVFTKSAIKDLLQLFQDNKHLKNIMQHTKIWATEEVIFPTLVKLLGYEIILNPFNSDYIKYKQQFTEKDLQTALKKPDAFWIHPIIRDYNHPLREQIRHNCHHYQLTKFIQQSTSPMYSSINVLEKVSQVNGWLDKHEADLLITLVHKVCNRLKAPHNIVEIGSYEGKSTVALGSVVKAFYAHKAKVYAIDPHDGVVGAADAKLEKLSPTLLKFEENMKKEKLLEVVVPIKDYSYNINWKRKISLLFIDGLHDYKNVARDFQHFAKWLRTGSYIAFHDYAEYYPGVVQFVDELLLNKKYQKIQLVNSLMILQKV